MIRLGGRGPIEGVEFRGAERAQASAAVLDAIAAADAIIIGPSNPVASIGPILAIPSLRDALAGGAAPGRGRQPDRRRRGAQGTDRRLPGPCRRRRQCRPASPSTTRA